MTGSWIRVHVDGLWGPHTCTVDRFVDNYNAHVTHARERKQWVCTGVRKIYGGVLHQGLW